MLVTRRRNMNMVPVKEEYYGASSNLKKAEKALEVIVKRIQSRSELEVVTLNINQSKENKILCKCFEKEFGFKEMHLFWANDSVPNAYTMPGGMILNQRPGIRHLGKNERDKYYDDDHAYDCWVVVIMLMVRNLHLSAKETMAIILHEIGHNFDNNITTVSDNYLEFISLMGLGDLMRLFGQWRIGGIGALQNQFPKLMFFIDLVQSLPYHLSPIVVCNVSNLVRYANPYFIWELVVGTNMEYYADSFAAKYGYGTDLASATMKFKDKGAMGGYASRAIHSVPVLKTLADIAEFPFITILQLVDVHPFDENRVLMIRHNLEKDYSNPNVPKEMKPEIKRQINQMDRMIEIEKEDSMKDGMIMSGLRRLFLYNVNSRILKAFQGKR